MSDNKTLEIVMEAARELGMTIQSYDSTQLRLTKPLGADTILLHVLRDTSGLHASSLIGTIPNDVANGLKRDLEERYQRGNPDIRLHARLDGAPNNLSIVLHFYTVDFRLISHGLQLVYEEASAIRRQIGEAAAAICLLWADQHKIQRSAHHT